MPSRSLTPRGRRAGVAALLVALTLSTVPIGAGAAPVDEAPSPEHLEQVAEQYNLARVKVERATALIAATNRRIQLAETRVATVRDRIRGRAAALYRRSTAGSPLPLHDTAEFTEQARHRRYLEAAELPDQELAKSLETEIATLREQERSQRDAQAMLQRDADDAARLKRKLADLARRAAASRVVATHDGAGPVAAPPSPAGGGSAPAPAPPTPSGPPTTPTTPLTTPPPPAPTPPPTNPPAPSSRAAAAVAFARAQLGKPYVFAAAGPDTFDCSGLTMAAWAAAGVRMPHYSGSQATMFPKVGWDQLQPGDIVVFYDDLHHVGLYIGGGQMIHAPQTGDVVRIAPAWRTTFKWGVRPG
jgi:cell wall-associated NlpC family hydrolase